MKVTQEVEIKVDIDPELKVVQGWRPVTRSNVPGYGEVYTVPELYIMARGENVAELVQSLHRLGDAILDAVEGKTS